MRVSTAILTFFEPSFRTLIEPRTAMSTQSPAGLRQRGAKDKKGVKGVDGEAMNGSTVEDVKRQAKAAVKNEWDFKLALSIITLLAFVSRFWGISHPDQVVFDEVHFGKVSRMRFGLECHCLSWS